MGAFVRQEWHLELEGLQWRFDLRNSKDSETFGVAVSMRAGPAGQQWQGAGEAAGGIGSVGQ